MLIWFSTHCLQLEKEISELKKQQVLAHSRIDDLLRAIETDKGSQKLNETPLVNVDGTKDLLYQENTEDSCSSNDISDLSQKSEDHLLGIGEDSDEVCKEVHCVDMDESDQDRSLRQLINESEESMPILSDSGNGRTLEEHALPALHRQITLTSHYGTLEQKFQDMGKTIDSLSRPYPDAWSPVGPSTSTTSGSLKVTRSSSCRANVVTASSDFEMTEQSESTPPIVLEEDFTGRPGVFSRKQWKLPPVIYGTNSVRLSRNDSQSSEYNSYVDEIRDQDSSHGDEDIPTLGSFVAGLKEMAKLQYENRTEYQVRVIINS